MPHPLTEITEPRTQEFRPSILSAISPSTRAIALVTLIAEAIFSLGVFAIQERQRLTAFLICAGVLILAIIACVLLELKSEKKRAHNELRLPDKLKGNVIVLDHTADIDDPSSGQISKIYRTASNLKFAGRFEDAIKQYYKILDEKPNHWKSRYNIGSCLFYSGQLDEAERHFKKLAADMVQSGKNIDGVALEIHHGCYIQLNSICDAREKYKDGIGFLVKSLDVKPDDALSYLNLTIASLKSGETEEAKKWYSILMKHPDQLLILGSMNEQDKALVESLSQAKEVSS